MNYMQLSFQEAALRNGGYMCVGAAASNAGLGGGAEHA